MDKRGAVNPILLGLVGLISLIGLIFVKGVKDLSEFSGSQMRVRSKER